MFRMCPGKAPRAERGWGEEASLHYGVLARRTKGSTNWLPLVAFGSLLCPLGSFLVLCGFVLVSFWFFFGCIGLTFCSPQDPICHFGDLLASFLIYFNIFNKNSCKIILFLGSAQNISRISDRNLHRNGLLGAVPLLLGPKWNLAAGSSDRLNHTK